MSYNISNYIQSPFNAITSNINFLLFSKIGSQIVQLFGVIDSIPEEMHAVSVGKSNYPIETGATSTDNVYSKPTELTIVGYISGVLVPKFSTLVTPYRDREGWERLLLQIKKGEQVSIVTLLTVYNHMIMTDLHTAKNAEIGQGSLVFTMKLEEALIAETETTKLPADNIKGAAQHKASVIKAGAKQSQSASWLSQTVDSFTGLF